MVIEKKIKIEVVYATNDQQKLISLEIPRGLTIEEAILASGICDFFPEIHLQKNKVGIFSQIKKLSDFVHSGDRIEIYRPLCMDPKEARRRKVKNR